MLLQMFAAVVVGGTAAGRRARRCRSARSFGAYILMIVVNILLVLNVSAYYSTVAEGSILILAVLAGSLEAALRRSRATCGALIAPGLARWRRRHAAVPSQARRAKRLTLARHAAAERRARRPSHRLWRRHAESAALCAAGLCLLRRWCCRRPSSSFGNALVNWRYYNSLIVLSSFLAILALGQGAVILTGGLDLSVPWTIGFCGILLAGMVNGSDARAHLCAAARLLVVGCADRRSSTALGIVLPRACRRS